MSCVQKGFAPAQDQGRSHGLLPVLQQSVQNERLAFSRVFAIFRTRLGLPMYADDGKITASAPK